MEINDNDKYDYPAYRRLTFIEMNSCDFCQNVDNPGPFMHYISFETKNGWVSCSNQRCKKMGDDAVKEYMRTKAYGKVNSLKNSFIKIKRTSGCIESNWKLSPVYVEPTVDQFGVERVCVVNETEEIEKWVNVEKILELNQVS